MQEEIIKEAEIKDSDIIEIDNFYIKYVNLYVK